MIRNSINSNIFLESQDSNRSSGIFRRSLFLKDDFYCVVSNNLWIPSKFIISDVISGNLRGIYFSISEKESNFDRKISPCMTTYFEGSIIIKTSRKSGHFFCNFLPRRNFVTYSFFLTFLFFKL